MEHRYPGSKFISLSTTAGANASKGMAEGKQAPWERGCHSWFGSISAQLNSPNILRFLQLDPTGLLPRGSGPTQSPDQLRQRRVVSAWSQNGCLGSWMPPDQNSPKPTSYTGPVITAGPLPPFLPLNPCCPAYYSHLLCNRSPGLNETLSSLSLSPTPDTEDGCQLQACWVDEPLRPTMILSTVLSGTGALAQWLALAIKERFST